jgi:hypothetical protein
MRSVSAMAGYVLVGRSTVCLDQLCHFPCTQRMYGDTLYVDVSWNIQLAPQVAATALTEKYVPIDEQTDEDQRGNNWG